jgi:protein TonB
MRARSDILQRNVSLLISGTAHCLLFLLLILVARANPRALRKASYTIDFIGAPPQTAARYGQPALAGKAAPASQAEKPKQPAKPEYAAQAQITKNAADNKDKTDKKKQPAETSKTEQKPALKKPSVLQEAESSQLKSLHTMETDGDGKAVQASFTNFPYPWYITQARNALWREWSKLMPEGGAELSALVSFSVNKSGYVYDVKVEKVSGDDSFDYAACAAVEKSAPYPPLPEGFEKDVLTVTVEFKTEQ